MLVACAFLFTLALPTTRAAEAVTNTPVTPMIEGVWRWDFTMPDGTTVKPRLMLTREQGDLVGTTSFRANSAAPITNLVFNGDILRFQVVRPREDKNVTTTYTGRWHGKTIDGKIESDWAGAKQIYDWKAEQTDAGVGGTWRWTVKFGGREFETRLDLTQAGDTLKGIVPGRGGRGGRGGRSITNGTIKNGEVYFELANPGGFGRGNRGGNNPPPKYRGVQHGDIIRGTLITTTNTVERQTKWEAHRDE